MPVTGFGAWKGGTCVSGNAAYVAATQVGDLAVATILGSLYPVTTIILAAIILRERITPRHAVGIATAAIAIGCIAAGSG